MNIGRARRTYGRLSRSGLVAVARRRSRPVRRGTAGIVRHSADYLSSTARARAGWDSQILRHLMTSAPRT
jgi:hypothetical protein